MVRLIDGEAVAARTYEQLRNHVATLADGGVTPGLATVSMSDDPADETYVDAKHEAASAIGVAGVRRDLDPTAPAEELYATIETLTEDRGVHGVFVQLPVPEHVDLPTVRERIDPAKDVDCFHPENLGRLVTGEPRFVPATTRAVQRLLAAADVDTDGADVVVVGRSDAIGKPLANHLIQKAPGGNATVTVCHSRTRDLAEKTRRADVVVAAAGVPGLIDGSMLEEGVVVIDVSVNRVDADDGKGYEVVGDVEFESASAVASAMTPVPGGVGPVTIAMLLSNVVRAASRGTGTPIEG